MNKEIKEISKLKNIQPEILVYVLWCNNYATKLVSNTQYQHSAHASIEQKSDYKLFIFTHSIMFIISDWHDH